MSSSSRLLPRALAASSTRRLYLLVIAATSFRTISAQTYLGCYSSSSPWEDQGFYRYQSYSTCQPTCSDKSDAVFGLSDGSTCWCGNELPALSTKVSDSLCNTPCDGYGKDTCGGEGYYAAYLTGLKPSVPHVLGDNSNGNTGSSTSTTTTMTPPSSTSSPSSSTHIHSTLTQTVGGATIYRTVGGSGSGGTSTPSATPTGSSSGSTNVGGIAAGVTVGVVGLAAIVAGIYFFLRRRRQQREGELSMRQNQVTDFMQGGRIPPSTAYSQMSDSRLEPEYGNSRNSVGSIVDAQDYSRRILRVANPDSS